MARVSSLSVLALVALSGCVTRAIGPTVAVMPGPNKPFDAFQQDQLACRQFADGQIGGPDAETHANDRQLASAVLGTVLGAGLGAALGGGRGAAIGAGGGALVGTGVGANGAEATQYDLQRRYDIAYEQCMYSRGNQVPGFAAVPAGGTAWGPTITPAPPSSGTVSPPASSPPPAAPQTR